MYLMDIDGFRTLFDGQRTQLILHCHRQRLNQIGQIIWTDEVQHLQVGQMRKVEAFHNREDAIAYVKVLQRFALDVLHQLPFEVERAQTTKVREQGNSEDTDRLV